MIDRNSGSDNYEYGCCNSPLVHALDCPTRLEGSFGVGQVRTTPAPGLGGLVYVAPEEYSYSVRTVRAGGSRMADAYDVFGLCPECKRELPHYSHLGDKGGGQFPNQEINDRYTCLDTDHRHCPICGLCESVQHER